MTAPLHGGPIEESMTHCSCGTRFLVLESRNHVINGVQTVYRRKGCPSCKARKSTYELDRALVMDILGDA